MVKGKKGFTLMELIIAMAVIGIATSLTAVFCISTTRSVKKAKIQNNAVYAVKDVHDFLFNWVSGFDSVEYDILSVQEDRITIKNTLTDDQYFAYYQDGTLVTQNLSGETSYDVSAVSTVKFARLNNAIKVTVEYDDKQTSFMIFKKTL